MVRIKELIIFNQSDWSKGRFKGSEVINDNLIGRKIKTNEDVFNNSIFTDWTYEVNDVYSNLVEVQKNKPFISSKVFKESRNIVKDEKLGYDSIYKASTKFKDEFNQDQFTEYLEINFNWNVQKTDKLDRLDLSINPNEENIIIRFNNRAEIQLIQGQNITFVKDSSSDSVGNIANIIDNNLNNWDINFKVKNNQLYIKFHNSGYKSIDYVFDLDSSGINELRIEQIAENERGSRFIESSFSINNMYANGYDSGVVYKSNIIDSQSKDTYWDSLVINYTVGVNIDSNLEDEITLYLYVNNDKTKLLQNINAKNYSKKITLSNKTGNYIENKDISIKEEEEEDIMGKYIYIEIEMSKRFELQNSIDYIRLEHLFPEDIEETLAYEDIEQKSVTKRIGNSGGIIDLEAENFSARLFIAEGIIFNPIDITLTRLSGKDDRLPDDFIGVKIEPKGYRLSKPALLEISYDGYQFNQYQSEKYLSISKIEDEVAKEMDTQLFKNKKVAVTYINEL